MFLKINGCLNAPKGSPFHWMLRMPSKKVKAIVKTSHLLDSSTFTFLVGILPFSTLFGAGSVKKFTLYVEAHPQMSSCVYVFFSDWPPDRGLTSFDIWKLNLLVRKSTKYWLLKMYPKHLLTFENWIFWWGSQPNIDFSKRIQSQHLKIESFGEGVNQILTSQNVSKVSTTDKSKNSRVFKVCLAILNLLQLKKKILGTDFKSIKINHASGWIKLNVIGGSNFEFVITEEEKN